VTRAALRRLKLWHSNNNNNSSINNNDNNNNNLIIIITINLIIISTMSKTLVAPKNTKSDTNCLAAQPTAVFRRQENCHRAELNR